MKLHIPAILITIFVLTVGFGAVNAADKDAKPAAASPPVTYPLKTCPISGDSLGEMGKPIKVSHDGTDVYLCCKSCIKDFNEDPAKYIKMVKDAEKKKAKQ